MKFLVEVEIDEGAAEAKVTEVKEDSVFITDLSAWSSTGLLDKINNLILNRALMKKEFLTRSGLMPQHKQVPTTRGIMVDAQLKDLLEALWQKGMETVNSCQENFPGITWIQFLCPGHALEFMDLASEVEGIDPLETSWQYDALPDYLPNLGFIFTVSVRFPKELLPAITRHANRWILKEYTLVQN